MLTSHEFCNDLSDFVADWRLNGTREQHLGDNPFPRFVLASRAESWSEFQQWRRDLDPNWCFRGQREATWGLSTSLDRVCLRRYESWADGLHSSGYYHLDREIEAHKHMEVFQRRLVGDGGPMPAENDRGSWYARAQHYGTPTRFLDWTASPLIAAHFALERPAAEGDLYSAIWALDLDWLERRAREFLPRFVSPMLNSEAEPFLLDKCHEVVAVRVIPRQTNIRMAAQQGVLLCKLRHDVYFSVTLMNMMIHPEVPKRPVLRKIEIGAPLRQEFLQRLKDAGVTRESLFPDA